MQAHYRAIQLKPDDFTTYLTKEIGFDLVEEIAPPTDAKSKGTPMEDCTDDPSTYQHVDVGFERAIYIFRKPGLV